MAGNRSTTRTVGRAAAIATSVAAALLLPFMAKAETVSEPDGFAWRAQTAVIDFAEPGSGKQFADLVEDAHEKSILYLDWTMKGAAGSGLFDWIGADSGDPGSDEAVCDRAESDAGRPGGFVISGRPDPDNNHLLLEMTLDTAHGAPFARVRCEYANAKQVLRVRGFFYVTNIGTATAHNVEFQPISIPAHVSTLR